MKKLKPKFRKKNKIKNQYYPHDEQIFYCTSCGVKLKEIYNPMYDDKTGEKYYYIKKECYNKQCYYNKISTELRNMLIILFICTVAFATYIVLFAL